MSISYTPLPPALRTEAQAYVENGTRPAALLLAALDNNLFDAMNALPGNMGRAELCAIVTWAKLEAPAISRGSATITDAWMQAGGLQGRAAARRAAEAIARAGSLAHTPFTPANVYSFNNLAATLRMRGALG